MGPFTLILFFISFFALPLPFFNISASTSILNVTSDTLLPNETISFSLLNSPKESLAITTAALVLFS
jgi:hypothetical protein